MDVPDGQNIIYIPCQDIKLLLNNLVKYVKRSFFLSLLPSICLVSVKSSFLIFLEGRLDIISHKVSLYNDVDFHLLADASVFMEILKTRSTYTVASFICSVCNTIWICEHIRHAVVYSVSSVTPRLMRNTVSIQSKVVFKFFTELPNNVFILTDYTLA